MLLKLGILSILLTTCQISESLANPQQCDNVASIEVCLRNKNVEVQVSTDDLTCQASEISRQKVRDDYTHIAGVGYYKFHTQAKNWNDARNVCVDEGGHLVIINSSEEEKAILTLYNKNKQSISNAKRTDSIWLGAHNMFAVNDWVTVLGERLSSSGYVNWSKGCDGYPAEPNGGDKERCLAMYGRCQGWNDYQCGFPLAFVCEIPDVCA